MIHYINSNEEWNAMATRHVDQKNIIVVCFSAEWCGPCKALEPKLKNISETYTNYEFYKVNIDKCPTVADKFNVSSVPTTMIIKDCNIYKTIMGVDILGLQAGLDNIVLDF